jgi:superfamily II DNA or RNA helicase
MKVAIDIIGRQLKMNKIANALVVVPTTNLIEQFKQEFDIWGFDYTDVDFLCIQSAYKLKAKYDLLVVDEIHTATGPEYQKVFRTVKYDQILGLTATPPEEMDIINKYCPIVYHKNLKDILDSKIVSDFKILNIPIKFSKREQAKYNKFNELFSSAQLQLNIARGNDPELKKINVFDMAQKYNSLKITSEDYQDLTAFKEQERLVKFAKQYWAAMSMRKWVCYNSEQKANAAIDIVKMYPDRK